MIHAIWEAHIHSRQVGLVHDETGGTEVSRNTNILNDLSESGERFGVGVWEGVLAWLGGVSAEGIGENGDVGGLVSGNLLKPVPYPGWESGIGERLSVHVVEGAGVEVA